MKKLLLLTFVTSFSAIALVDRPLGESPRALLMGDAYTSIADDEYTLHYNPAIMARHKAFSFFPLNPRIAGTNILKEPDRFEDTGSTTAEFAEVAMDFPVHIGVDWAPGFKMGRFGASAISYLDTNFNLQNPVTPVLDVDYRNDKGFIMGYAHPLSGSFTTGSGGEHLALGVSLKYIKREAIYGSYNLTGITLLDAVSAGEAEEILNALGRINGSGWGADIGLDYAKGSGNQTFTMGLMLRDVYTLMHTEKNDNDLEVQTQPMKVNFGTSWQGALSGGFNFTVSADIKHLETQDVEFARRLHLGLEIGLSHALSLMAGVNALDNYSYGVKLNTGLIKAYAGFYGKETGEKIGQQESNRFLVYFSLLHFTFDP